MRTLLVKSHRWLGLFMAGFLFVSGLTGAVISWDHELDEWLNPQLFEASREGRPLTPLELAARLEAARPEAMVTFLPLAHEPGQTLLIGVAARPDAITGKAPELPYNQIALDPAGGDIQGSRLWGDISLSRENLLPFLYKLHYSMHLPDGFGLPLGVLFMGIIAMVWVIDCFIALRIALPSTGSWRKSFTFRWRQGGYKLNFDLHRSGGLWLWLLLLVLAVTSVSMNLNREVMRPLVALFSPLTPSPFDTRTPRAPDQPLLPRVERADIIAAAQAEAARRGWQQPAGSLFYSPAFGIYGVGFHAPGNSHGDGGLGNAWLLYDGLSGRPAGEQVPGVGSAGDIFLQAQFPLHSGRLFGTTGRVLISLLGLLVAMLSLTGMIIWLRKRQARRRVTRRLVMTEVRGS